MITHIVLRNWKAYSALDLRLEGGATFIIARNGIGKTSLVQGAMWALFGESSGVDAASCLRSGAPETSAEVSVALSNGLAVISRSYSADTRKTETAITFGGQTTAGTKAVERYLSEGLGAEPSILARMSFLTEGEAVRADSSATEDLTSHLSRVFGVDALVRLGRGENQRRRRLTREAQETRRKQRLAETVRADLAGRLEQLEAELARLREEQRAARTALDRERDALATLKSWREFHLQRQRWLGQRRTRVEDASRHFGMQDASEAAVVAWLETARQATQTRLEELSREAGGVDTERSMLVGLASTLDSNAQECPVCLRPITGAEREHAQRAHADRVEGLAERAAAISDEVHTTRARMKEIDEWLRELMRSPDAPTPPSAQRPEAFDEGAIAVADEAVERATLLLEEVSSQVTRLEHERSAVSSELQTDAEAVAQSQELFRRYREEALSELAATTLERTAEEIGARRIDPLATEIQNRWKLLWPTRAPIKLRSDGRLVALRAGREVPYSEFSGGEKVISTIILRLLALSMTTTTPFLWLDEPLEHLDPRNRRMVASLLVKASQGSRTRQIVATTYEEAVARRLDDVAAARLLYVETDPAG
jgi:DNA repair exonuclease SbcCD ATPase subunit